jgi:hypothetical protein
MYEHPFSEFSPAVYKLLNRAHQDDTATLLQVIGLIFLRLKLCVKVNNALTWKQLPLETIPLTTEMRPIFGTLGKQ